ncbi:MAG TPA: diguanylate cyclase, partial [Burkholderiales bacterium]|nr:diguanylate cyclase [Burkholderiales bacterium]
MGIDARRLTLNPWRLRSQLLVLVAVTALPLIGLQAYLLHRDAIDTDEAVRDVLIVRAERTAAVLEDLLRLTQDVLKSVAARPRVRALDPARCDPILTDVSAAHRRYANMVVVDRAGRIVCSAVALPGGRPGSAVGREGYERTLRENRSVLTSAFVGPITGRWVAVMTYPLHGAEGELTGMVALPIDLANLQSLVQGGELPANSVVVVTDAAEQVVARSYDTAAWVGESSSHLAVVANTREVARGTVTGRGIDGIERIYGFRTIPEFGWKVWNGMPTALVYAEARRRVVIGVLVSLAVLAAVGATALALARRIAAPMHRLAQTANRIATGDTAARASPIGPAELTEIAEQFNAMLDAQALAQKRLRGSEERLRLAVHAASIGSWEVDLLERQAYFSPEWKGQLGYDDDEISDRFEEWEDRLHPQDRVPALGPLADDIAAPSSYAMEIRLRHRDGGYRWFDVRAAIERDAAGRALRLRGCQIDITARKRAEEKEHALLVEAQRARAALLSLTEDQQRTAETLRKSEASLEAAQERARLGSWDLDPRAQIGTWSREMFRLFERDPALGPPKFAEFTESVHPEDRPAILATYQRLIDDGGQARIEFRSHPDRGPVKHFDATVYAIANPSGSIERLAGTVLDVTERKQAEDRVRRLNRVYAMLSGINALIVRADDRDELFREACRLAVEVGRFQIAWIGVIDRDDRRVVPQALCGEDAGFLAAIKDRLQWRDDADDERESIVITAIKSRKPLVVQDVERDPRIAHKQAHAERGMRSVAMLPLLADDHAIGVLALGSKDPGFFDDEEVRLLVELAGDIAFALDHIEKGERISYLAYYDSLTGLANRTLFHERLTQFLRTAERERHGLALAVMDIDHFKTINDALGRQIGDALLAQFARRLESGTQEASEIARLGADRFAIVFPDVRGENEVVRLLEERLPQYIGDPFVLGDNELRVSVRVGLALFPSDAMDADNLFRDAEAALKKAKTGGERFLFYTQQMTDRVAEKLALENRLRR